MTRFPIQTERQILLEPDQQIGPYRLLFELGSGGAGSVWAAHRIQETGLKNVIALKITECIDEDQVELFLDEARVAALLHHTTIVPCLDLGREKRWFYMAMKLVRGPSLFALLSRAVKNDERLPPSIVWWIGLQVSRALDYAHARAEGNGRRLRLIHRDISPQNILCDATGSVQVTDFGAARSSIQRHQSIAGYSVGKPSYMSPEQARGQAVDAKTDLFSLGTVLYESAECRRLFYSSEGIDATLERVIKETPPPLKSIPAPLAQIIERMLQKDPGQRPASAAEVHASFQAIKPHIPGSANAEIELGRWIRERFGDDAFELIETPDPTHVDITRVIPKHGTWAQSNRPRPMAPNLGFQPPLPVFFPAPPPSRPNRKLLFIFIAMATINIILFVMLWATPPDSPKAKSPPVPMVVVPASPSPRAVAPRVSEDRNPSEPSESSSPSNPSQRVRSPSKPPPPPQKRRPSRRRSASPSKTNRTASRPPRHDALFSELRRLPIPDATRQTLLMELTEIPRNDTLRLIAFDRKLRAYRK